MNKRSLFPIVIAAVAALVYFFVLNMAKTNLEKSQNLEKVYVAKNDLAENVLVEEKDLIAVGIPSAYIQKDAYVKSRGADIKNMTNLVTKIAIAKGNQITKPALATLNPEMGISLKVQPKQRAYILPVNNQVAKMIKPGDKIDILVTFDANTKTGGKEKNSVTILQNVLVLGVGSDLGQGLDNASKVRNKEEEQNNAAFSDTSALSLALDLQSAQILALCQETGEVNVVVRSRGDSERPSVTVTNFSTIFQ